MAKKNEKAKMEDEIKALQKHMGGLVKTVLDLKSTVEILQKKVENDFNDEVNNIIEKQKSVDKAIAANEAALSEINKELTNLHRAKPDIVQKDAIEDRSVEKQNNVKRKKCRYFNRGFCKYKLKCRYSHPKKVCEEYLKSQECGKKDCCERHPKICKWLESRDGCKRNGECDYLHVDKVAVKESQNYKCSGCKDVWGNRECVVEHILSNTRTFFCLNCNDWIKNKISVLEPGWTLLDEAGCLRTEI